jgi:hypothetical protein
MSIVPVQEKILSKRGPAIQKLLRRISKDPRNGPAWRRVSGASSLTFAAHEGAPPTSHYRDWRFNTIVPGVTAQYFEAWGNVPGTNNWFLEKAYLHLFVMKSRTEEQEVFCLHCDPNEGDSERHAIYKKGPHVHMISSVLSLSHAHIPLNLCHLKDVLESHETLFKAFDIGIEMVRDQILTAFLSA